MMLGAAVGGYVVVAGLPDREIVTVVIAVVTERGRQRVDVEASVGTLTGSPLEELLGLLI